MKPRIKTSRNGGAIGIKSRRERVIKRLEAQLKAGIKSVKDDQGSYGDLPLTESDKERITKEISTLKSRI